VRRAGNFRGFHKLASRVGQRGRRRDTYPALFVDDLTQIALWFFREGTGA